MILKYGDPDTPQRTAWPTSGSEAVTVAIVVLTNMSSGSVMDDPNTVTLESNGTTRSLEGASLTSLRVIRKDRTKNSCEGSVARITTVYV